MLSPPIDNFKEPEFLFQIERIKGKPSIDHRYITSFHFSHLVSIVVPDTLTLSDSLTTEFALKNKYYKIVNFPISGLADRIFMNCFINNGKLTLLSINTRIDCDNTVAVTTNGELILNLDKDTYQSFGIDGKVSHFGAKVKNRYIVTVDLKDRELQNSPAKLKKLKNRLDTLGKFQVILSWDPHDNEVCPSSIAKYIDNLDYEITVCNTDFQSNIVYSVKTPVIELENIENTDIVDFLEWLGMVLLGGDLETDSPSDYVNSYVVPTPNVDIGQIKCLQFRGLFTPDQIQEILGKYLAYCEQNDKPWIAVYVQGFSDAPVTWANEEQNFFTSGDNGYAVIFNKSNGLYCSHKSSRKRYK